MSRHRNVRSMNVSEEYEGFDDVYGHSVEDDFCISPSDAAQFMYDRTRQPQMSAFFNEEDDIAEEDETNAESAESNKARHTSGNYRRPALSDLDEARLSSCLEEIRNVVGDIVPEQVLVKTIIHHDFNIDKALDDVLNNATAATVPRAEEPPKPQRERKERTEKDDDDECGFHGDVPLLTNQIENLKLSNKHADVEHTCTSSAEYQPHSVCQSTTFQTDFNVKNSQFYSEAPCPLKHNCATEILVPQTSSVSIQSCPTSSHCNTASEPYIFNLSSFSYPPNISRPSNLYIPKFGTSAREDSDSEDSDSDCTQSTLAQLAGQHQGSPNLLQQSDCFSSLADLASAHLKGKQCHTPVRGKDTVNKLLPSAEVTSLGIAFGGKQHLTPKIGDQEPESLTDLATCFLRKSLAAPSREMQVKHLNSPLSQKTGFVIPALRSSPQQNKDCRGEDPEDWSIDLTNALIQDKSELQLAPECEDCELVEVPYLAFDETVESSTQEVGQDCLLDGRKVLRTKFPLIRRVSSAFGKVVCKKWKKSYIPNLTPTKSNINSITSFLFDTLSPDDFIFQNMMHHNKKHDASN